MFVDEKYTDACVHIQYIVYNMPCALGYEILKSLTSFTIASVCVCARGCVLMTENTAPNYAHAQT